MAYLTDQLNNLFTIDIRNRADTIVFSRVDAGHDFSRTKEDAELISVPAPDGVPLGAYTLTANRLGHRWGFTLKPSDGTSPVYGLVVEASFANLSQVTATDWQTIWS
ncbi:hypothetical protein JCM19240_3980 [Vibrio maritimus]|uniref:Uncharacterized protein n=1 Tax=Vibrio maritimus TaxID=990268 RepID=A0A090THQ3_9VIBR|nr:hypothetical protein JCM19240_3980 [Vibrio maritimus]